MQRDMGKLGSGVLRQTQREMGANREQERRDNYILHGTDIHWMFLDIIKLLWEWSLIEINFHIRNQKSVVTM